jgi:hypothetical protein
VAILPGVTAAVESDVQPARGIALSITHGKRKRVGSTRDADQVDVVRHQAGAQDAPMAVGGVPGQQGEVGMTVLVVIEDIAAEVAALGDVVRARSVQISSIPSMPLLKARHLRA